MCKDFPLFQQSASIECKRCHLNLCLKIAVAAISTASTTCCHQQPAWSLFPRLEHNAGFSLSSPISTIQKGTPEAEAGREPGHLGSPFTGVKTPKEPSMGQQFAKPILTTHIHKYFCLFSVPPFLTGSSSKSKNSVVFGIDHANQTMYLLLPVLGNYILPL